MKFSDGITVLKNSKVFTNSIWGLASSVLQNIFLSLFFIIVARIYTTFDFAQFLIANTFYQIVAAFSTLGLGQWFIREYLISTNRRTFVSKFLKIQFFSGIVFYVLNIALVYSLYKGQVVRSLAIILGINVVFDNVIFAIKNLNIADFEQQKTFRILLLDALLRFIVGVALFVYPFSITVLSVIMIITRLATLNLFVIIGVKDFVGFRSIWKEKVDLSDFKKLILANWSFIVIGSVSIIYWRIASIVISKVLSLRDLASYEISFKVFLLAQLVPLILSSSVFPSLVKTYNSNEKQKFQSSYNQFYLIYFIFGIASYTFIYSFADFIIPFAFGNRYHDTSFYTKEMFFTMIVFPTFFLQANILIVMKMERTDMLFNIIGIASYLILGAIGLTVVKSLSVINYSIFISFILVHILQDLILVRKNVTTWKHALGFYIVTIFFVLGYNYASHSLNPFLVFFSFWFVVASVVVAKRNLLIKLFSPGIQVPSGELMENQI